MRLLGLFPGSAHIISVILWSLNKMKTCLIPSFQLISDRKWSFTLWESWSEIQRSLSSHHWQSADALWTVSQTRAESLTAPPDGRSSQTQVQLLTHKNTFTGHTFNSTDWWTRCLWISVCVVFVFHQRGRHFHSQTHQNTQLQRVRGHWLCSFNLQLFIIYCQSLMLVDIKPFLSAKAGKVFTFFCFVEMQSLKCYWTRLFTSRKCVLMFMCEFNHSDSQGWAIFNINISIFLVHCWSRYLNICSESDFVFTHSKKTIVAEEIQNV